MVAFFDFKIFFVILIIVTTFFGIYFKWNHSYWRRKGLPYLKPSIPFGNMSNLIMGKTSFGLLLEGFHHQLKSLGYKHGGIFNFATPVYMPIDTEYVKNVLQADFKHFIDRGIYYNAKDDPMSASMFALSGTRWRKIRTTMSPTFTISKIKTMFEIMLAVVQTMEIEVGKFAEGRRKAIDVKEIAACFTTDIIGSCAFGLECNSFLNSQSAFRINGQRAFMLKSLVFFYTSQPKLARALRRRLFPKDVSEFFFDIIEKTVAYREINNIKRNDILQTLIDLKNDKSENSITIQEIVAHVSMFFLAGYETSSTTIAMCLFELAKNEKVQNNLRNEIRLKIGDKKLTYDVLNEMTYLTQVIDETLRMYPPLSQMQRKCVENYTIPNTDIIIEKGIKVLISIFGIHHDPDNYSNPEIFDPDRFSIANRQTIKQFTYLPFGEGPRSCIGIRFGITQVKLAVVTLLNSFKFSISHKTVIPIEINPKSITFATKHGIWLNVEKI